MSDVEEALPGQEVGGGGSVLPQDRRGNFRNYRDKEG